MIVLLSFKTVLNWDKFKNEILDRKSIDNWFKFKQFCQQLEMLNSHFKLDIIFTDFYDS